MDLLILLVIIGTISGFGFIGYAYHLVSSTNRYSMLKRKSKAVFDIGMLFIIMTYVSAILIINID